MYRYIIISVLLGLIVFPLHGNNPDAGKSRNPNRSSIPKPGKRTYETVRLSAPAPSIDGKLIEDCWLNDGEWAGNYSQQMPVEGSDPSQETELKILYDDKYIYVGIRAFNDPGKINFRPAKRDEFGGDMVGVAFDSYHDERTAFEFDISASGGKTDLILMNFKDIDRNWNAVWDGKTAVEDSAWTAEMRIPLSQLRYANQDEQVWGLHAWRWHSRNSEESQWALIRRDSPSFLAEFGNLTGLETRKNNRRLEIMPYGLGMIQRSKEEEGNPFASGFDHRFSAGLDAKVGLSTDFTMDIAVNPDFGQVEADPSVLNLTAYETFYDEKRPFFLEGNNILDYEFGDENQLFYSRRIGQRPHYRPDLQSDEYSDIPDNTSILSAVKVSGKNSRGLSLGIMQSVTAREMAEISSGEGAARYETVEPLTSYFVVRVQQDYNQANTIIGGMITATNRDLREDHLNFMTRSAYTGGLDFKHQWRDKTYYIKFNGIFSSVYGDQEAITRLQYSPVRYLNRPDFHHLAVDSSLTSMSGTGAELEIGKAGNGRLRYNFGLSYASPKLEINDIGYMTFTDILRQGLTLEYVITEPFSVFRTFSAGIHQYNSFNTGGYYASSMLAGRISTLFENQWHAFGFSFRRFEGLSTRSLRGGPAMLLPWQWSNGLSMRTDRSKNITFMFNMRAGITGDGISKDFSYNPGLTFRLGNSIQLTGEMRYNKEKENLQYVSHKEFNGEQRYIMGLLDRKTMGFTLRADYGITPDLTIQYYGSPYISTGIYNDFKRITDSRASLYEDRFHIFTGQEISLDGQDNTYYIDENLNGTADYSFSNPDFNFRQFRSNLVARWEYKPGSVLYFVWQHSMTGHQSVSDPSLAHNFGQLWDIFPSDVIMLKLNYWFSL